MRARPLIVLLPLALLLAAGCSRRHDSEQAEAAKAAMDSIAQQMAEEAAMAVDTSTVDSTTVTLDSGVWNIEEPDEEYTYEPQNSDGIPYEQWKRVSDDTVVVQQRQFNEARLTEYLQDPDLDYDRVIHHDDLLWDRFTRWLNKMLRKLFGTRGGELVWENMEWVVLGIAVVTIAWFFRKHLFGGVFGVASKRARQVTEIEENIEELDLVSLLNDAEKARNWRLALRYQWLKVLRRLVDDGLIKWQPRFTDADYLAQLKDPILRVTFSELSFLFKWVWYGDAPMDAARYERMKPSFLTAQLRSTAATARNTASKTTPAAASTA